MTAEQLDILIKTARVMIERKDTSEYSANVREVARVALESLLQLSGNSEQVNSTVVPDGYKLVLVPMEHTDAFRSACTVAFEEFNRGTGPCGVFIAGHRAMLATAPQHKAG
ncbi:hypothetical protein [Pectobacterium odoriferum]|uniref:hypothetical protein n=1 Tax=Pectobacterium odoriferum TaxID=78398 RepID=UPI001CF48811|nr:hypothetical protein [Pectobacterium odoriferum]MCA6962458.1 hypothetical protein [Pectobacterium odoriferum]MCH5010554.1 hypothetical protein [Pectobacterium odoriferum]